MDSLPEPDAAALAASRTLARRLNRRIASAGGWIGFDAFMDAALYEPGLGYYAGGAVRFGPAGDFETAPGISPLYGACVARQCLQWLDHVPAEIYEFGAGTGQLAAQVLNELARHGRDDVCYRIVEVSAALRAQQAHTIGTIAPEALGRVQWLDALPERFSGLVIGNELLDAVPVRLFALSQSRFFERGVVQDPQAIGGFAWADRPAGPAFEQSVRASLAQAGWGGGDPDDLRLDAWPDGYHSEYAERADAWLLTIGERLETGAVLLVDYGFPASEFYHPQRHRGTLVCHYRHRVHDDPLRLVGLQDVTAHVDFTRLDLVASVAGMRCLGYTSQANFLLNCGLLEALSEVSESTSGAQQAYLRQAQAVQTLVSEAEMGELFKVIAFGRSMPDEAIGFERGDRRGALACAG
ncbi:MAG: SAM-dependent methyltransferase [Burkholderiaceae bacterium]